MPDDAIQALLDAIAAGDDDETESAALACAQQPRVLPALRLMLVDPDRERRWWAVRTLAILGGDEAADLAVEALMDPDEATRCAAALTLGQLRSERGISALTSAMAGASGWVRDSAADALAMIGAPALPALVHALTDDREGVRVRAAGALRRIVLPALEGFRTNEYPQQYRSVISALHAALNDTNRLVRNNAYEALNALGLFDQVAANT